LSFQFVFKLTAAKQQDHFFQAAYLEERDAWVRDIKKAIHCIDGGQRFARKSTRKSIRLPETINLRFVLIALLPHLLPSAGCVREISPWSGRTMSMFVHTTSLVSLGVASA